MRKLSKEKFVELFRADVPFDYFGGRIHLCNVEKFVAKKTPKGYIWYEGPKSWRKYHFASKSNYDKDLIDDRDCPYSITADSIDKIRGHYVSALEKQKKYVEDLLKNIERGIEQAKNGEIIIKTVETEVYINGKGRTEVSP